MSAPPGGPTLVLVVGPPAVGKMTVGHAIAARTGLRLFHNHHSIDLVLRFFEYGTPPFHRLVGEIRRRIMEEVAGSALPGLVFTYVWAFDDERDAASVERFAGIFRAHGGRMVIVELEATQVERLRRNETEFRLAEKPFKRDLATSRAQLVALDAQYRLSSGGALDGRDDFLRVDNTALEPAEVADRVIARFGLPRLAPARAGGAPPASCPPMHDVATIGYEAATVPRFLDALRAAGVELLVDVRALAMSRRPGFAKTALAANLATVGVDYLHLRRLGTPAEGRAAARAGRHDEMRDVFLAHMATDDAQAELARLADVVRAGRRVALMCFEADPAHCHRTYVAEALGRLLPIRVAHLAAHDPDD